MTRKQVVLTQPNKPANVKRDPVASGERDASVNRAASHEYFMMERYECGIMLRGTEVKSIRSGQANLKDAFGLIQNGELFLLNAHIGIYAPGAQFNHDTTRTRKLLAHSAQLLKLHAATQQKGFTLIPTRMYFKNGRVKVEIAVAKGKQLWDKRETERRRTADKEARDAISRSRKA
jgi:SsrA-binding protein